MKCIEEEIPFEVPEGWAWARLASLIELFITGPFGSALHKSDYVVDGIPLINPMNIIDGKVIPIDKMQVLPETVERLYSFKVAPNDIVIARRGDMGRCAVVNSEQKGWLCGTGSFVLRLPAVLCSEYFAVCLRSPYSIDLMSESSVGNTMLNLNQTILKSILIPVPPCTEQNRIINAIFDTDTLLSKITDQSKSLIMCVAKTKSKILDLAIRGKLVPQDPNDEPASVLLERIQAEKEELIRQGKIKRDKRESVIFKGDDNSYYQDLPENWKITTLRKITTPLTLNDGDWILSENMSASGEVKLLQLGSIGNMVYIDKGFKYLTKQTFDELSCTAIFPKYLLINRIISDKMCCCIIPNIEGTIITTVDTCWIAPCSHIYNLKFLMYQLASPFFQSMVLMKATGTTRKRISKNNLIDLPLLLPPLAEQNRIVEVIETAFTQLDEIANSIT